MEYQVVNIRAMAGLAEQLRLDIFVEGGSLHLEFGQHSSRKESDGGFCGRGVNLDIPLSCLAKQMRELMGGDRITLRGELPLKDSRQYQLFPELPEGRGGPEPSLPRKEAKASLNRLIRVSEAADKLEVPLWGLQSKIFFFKVPTISTPAIPASFIAIRDLEKLYGAEKVQCLLEEEE